MRRHGLVLRRFVNLRLQDDWYRAELMRDCGEDAGEGARAQRGIEQPAEDGHASLMAGEGKRVPDVVRGVMQYLAVGEADAPEEKRAEQRRHRRGDQGFQAGRGLHPDLRRRSHPLRLHRVLSRLR
jgi:hypothetical protein